MDKISSKKLLLSIILILFVSLASAEILQLDVTDEGSVTSDSGAFTVEYLKFKDGRHIFLHLYLYH